MSAQPVGAVRDLFRYPVKSMAGEALAVAAISTDHGVLGDRAYALIDRETGKVASAKHPRHWGALLDCRAEFIDPPAAGQSAVRISLPDGEQLRSDSPEIDDRLSRALGRPVRLSSAPPAQAIYDEHKPGQPAGGGPLAVGAGAGTFFDFAPIHLVTTASLARLHELRPASRFAVARFRPNLVIDTGAAHGFVENDWLGQLIEIGAQVQLCITFPCPRCVITTLAQGELAADPEVLRTAAAHNPRMFALLAKRMPVVGAYATVVRGGTIHPGDAVRLTGRAPLRRVAAFVGAVKRAVRRR